MRKGKVRNGWLVAGAVLALAAVMPAAAQQQAGSFLTGINPRQIKTVRVDTNKAMKPSGINKAFHQAPKPNFFNLSKIFPKANLASFPPVRSTASVLDKKNNPFQPNPIAGKNPFDFVSKTTKTKAK